jgi:hypothetical protein
MQLTFFQAPYGYGKTHGYTRIISVVPQPLLMGATDTLKAAVESLSSLSTPVSKNDITLNDLKAALRQQVRYTCRLNHIAAHTAIWSVGTFSREKFDACASESCYRFPFLIVERQKRVLICTRKRVQY